MARGMGAWGVKGMGCELAQGCEWHEGASGTACGLAWGCEWHRGVRLWGVNGMGCGGMGV